MAKQTYPEVALLKQMKGVGDLIATAYVLTIEDPQPRQNICVTRSVRARTSIPCTDVS